MMHMTFHWSRKVTLLFDGWRTKTWSGYALALATVFLAAVFYQYMEARRQRFRALTLLRPAPFPDPAPAAEAPLLGFSAVGRAAAARAAVAVLFGVNSAIGYLLMLAVMSYNGGVFVAVIVGLAVGYFAFRSGGEEDAIAIGKPCSCS